MNRKVLFVHDGPMFIDENGEFYGISLTDEIVRRYSFFGAEVIFLMRLKKIRNEVTSKYSKISYSLFQFIEIPNFKQISNFYINKKKARTAIETAVMQCNVVIVRLPSAAGVMAFNYAKKHGKPTLVEFVACVFDSLWNYNWKGKLLAHYKYINYRLLMKHASHTIYVTNRFLQGRYPTNGKSVGCSDVEVEYKDSSVVLERLNKISNQERPLILGTIGAFDVPYKGQEDVIKAIGILKKNGVVFKYRLVGRGASSRIEKASKKHDVEDLVEIVGQLPHKEIFAFFRTIDIYIQPSKMEGMPRALIEAMSTACPALGSTAGGIPELLSKDAVFKKGKITEIIRLLTEITPSFLVDMAQRNYIEAHKYRTIELEERRMSFYKDFKKFAGFKK